MRRFALLAIIVLTSCLTAQADIVMSLTKITNESDIINVENYGSVKYAINYGNTKVSNSIAGITFVNQGGTSLYKTTNSTNVYNSNMESYAAHSYQSLATTNGSYSGTTSTELNKLLSDMIYNGGQTKNTSTVLTFGNLEAGKTYTARVLARAWGVSDNRKHEFSIDTNADGVADQFTSNLSGTTVSSQQVSEDNPFLYAGESGYTGAYAVDFTFTAQSNTASISLKEITGDNYAWHNYGVMLIENSTEQVTPTTPTIYNGSFEADSFVISSHSGKTYEHGYVQEAHAGLISGWQYTAGAGLAWKGSACQDFLCNQTPTNGSKVAFVQSSSNGQARLYQNVSGFDPDSDTVYRLTMDWGRRTSGVPSGSIFIGADKATESAYISNKSISGGFQSVSTVFRPNATTQTIAIQNQTSGDTTLLVDNVQLKAYQMNTFFSDNYNVKANKFGTEIGGPSSNDTADRFSAGLMGGLGYSYSAQYDYQVQVHNGDTAQGLNSLFMVSRNSSQGGQTHTSPNWNFNNNFGTTTVAEEGGRMYEISFKVNPVYDDTDSTNWAAILFGLSESKRYANVNGSDGVGILFRKNGGVQVFDGGTNVYSQEGVFSLITDSEGYKWANVRIEYYVPDFNESSKVDVTLYINDKMITTYQTTTGFTDNFIQLESYSNKSDWARTLFDDFQIKSSANYYYDVSNTALTLSRNWALNGKDKQYIQFQSQRDGSSSANHSGQLAMEGASYIDVADGYEFTQSGAITGSNTLTKKGEGTLTISGSGTGFTGITTISEGTVKLTNTAGQALAGSCVTVGDNGTLLLGANQTLSSTRGDGILKSSGTIDLSSYNLTINGNNHYNNVTGTLKGSGTLYLTDSTSTKDTIQGSTHLGADITGFSGTFDIQHTRLYLMGSTTIGADQTLNINISNSGQLLLGKDIKVNMTLASEGAVETSGGINYGGIRIAASKIDGTITLAGNSSIRSSTSNTITIDATVDLGAYRLTVGKTTSPGNYDSSNIVITNAISGEGGSLVLNSNKELTLSQTNTYTGSTTVTAGTLKLMTENSIASSSSVVNNGTITMSADQTFNNLSGTSSSASINMGTSDLTLNANANTSYSGTISGSGNVEKTGASTLTLNNGISYTGTTTVSEGILELKNSGGNKFYVSHTGLEGSGTINVTNADASTQTFFSISGATAETPLAFSGTINVSNGKFAIGTSTEDVAPTNFGNATINLTNNANLLIDATETAASALVIKELNGTAGTVARLGGPRTSFASGTTLTVGSGNFAGLIGYSANAENRKLSLIKNSDGSADGGTLILSGDNNYTGGTIINAGTVSAGHNNAFGTGKITFNGGTLTQTGDRNLYNDIEFAANSSTILKTNGLGNMNLRGKITGTGTVTRNEDNGTILYLRGNVTEFAGTFNFKNVQLIGVNAGSANAIWNTSGYLMSYIGANTIQLGELNGSATIYDFLNTSGTTTYKIGGKNTDSNFSGTIKDGTAVSNKQSKVHKVGTGVLELSGNNTYSGGTTIETGTIKLTDNGTLGSGTVDISNGATLEFNVDSGSKKLTNAITGSGTLRKTGNGILQLDTTTGNSMKASSFYVEAGRLDMKENFAGSLQIEDSATMSPGNSVGKLTVDGNVSFNAGSTLLLEQDSTGMDQLILTAGHTLTMDSDSILELAMGSIQPGGNYAIITSLDGFTEEQQDVSYWTKRLAPGLDYFWNLSVVGNTVWAQIDPNAVPEPSTWVLLILGTLGLMWLRRKHGRR